jgi:hypothetical protein
MAGGRVFARERPPETTNLSQPDADMFASSGSRFLGALRFRPLQYHCKEGYRFGSPSQNLQEALHERTLHIVSTAANGLTDFRVNRAAAG